MGHRLLAWSGCWEGLAVWTATTVSGGLLPGQVCQRAPVASFCFCAKRLRSGPSEQDTDRTEWQGLRGTAVCAQGLALGQAHRPGFHAPDQAPKGRTRVSRGLLSAGNLTPMTELAPETGRTIPIHRGGRRLGEGKGLS